MRPRRTLLPTALLLLLVLAAGAVGLYFARTGTERAIAVGVDRPQQAADTPTTGTDAPVSDAESSPNSHGTMMRAASGRKANRPPSATATPSAEAQGTTAPSPSESATAPSPSESPTAPSASESPTASAAAQPPSDTPAPVAAAQSTPSPTVDNSYGWLSGASGIGASTDEFGAWRGRTEDIVGTWDDGNTAMVELWQFKDELVNWHKPVDVAIGAIGEGESWQAAASGAYDARWTKSLQNLRALRSNGKDVTYIRLAHEMNGYWFPWGVNTGNYQSFVTAWHRFRALQQQYFPESKLVFCLNRETNGAGMDWRQFYPGDGQVDVLGVDYYNNWPYVSTQAQWDASVNAVDQYGAPKGLSQYLAFAKTHGVPLAVPEWAGNAGMGDSPEYIQDMHDFFSANAGSGAGQLLYDIYFNVDKDGSQWHLYGAPTTRMPNSALEYQNAF